MTKKASTKKAATKKAAGKKASTKRVKEAPNAPPETTEESGGAEVAEVPTPEPVEPRSKPKAEPEAKAKAKAEPEPKPVDPGPEPDPEYLVTLVEGSTYSVGPYSFRAGSPQRASDPRLIERVLHNGRFRVKKLGG